MISLALLNDLTPTFYLDRFPGQTSVIVIVFAPLVLDVVATPLELPLFVNFATDAIPRDSRSTPSNFGETF